ASAPCAAVAVEGGEAGESGELAPVEVAEFGQFGDQGACDRLADAGHGGEEVLLGAPGGGAADGAVDLAFDVGELGPEDGEDLFDGPDGLRLCGLASPVPFGGHHLDDLASSCDEFVEVAGGLIRQGARF